VFVITRYEEDARVGAR